MPERGAKLSQVVCQAGAPAGASAIAEGVVKLVTATNPGLPSPDGAGFTSHRAPYVSGKRRVTFQVSCANAENWLNRSAACGLSLMTWPAPAVPASSKGTVLN